MCTEGALSGYGIGHILSEHQGQASIDAQILILMAYFNALKHSVAILFAKYLKTKFITLYWLILSQKLLKYNLDDFTKCFNLYVWILYS